jgi:hypothetical protein
MIEIGIFRILTNFESANLVLKLFFCEFLFFDVLQFWSPNDKFQNNGRNGKICGQEKIYTSGMLLLVGTPSAKQYNAVIKEKSDI